jgi:leucyl aminopeptidase
MLSHALSSTPLSRAFRQRVSAVSSKTAGRRSLFSKAAPKGPQVHVVAKSVPGQAKVVFYAEEEVQELMKAHGLPKVMSEELKGKVGHTTAYIPRLTEQAEAEGAAPREIFVGIGKRNELRPKHLRKAISAAVGALKSKKLTTATIVVPSDLEAPSSSVAGPHMSVNEPRRILQAEIVQQLTNAILNGCYKFDKYITKEDEKPSVFESVSLQVQSEENVVELQKVSARAAVVSRAIALCRNLGNERADIATPAWYEKRAYELASSHPTKLTMECLHAADLKGLGMNLLLSVGQGAAIEPRLILLHYNGAPESNEKIALVGKGITFDTGGINLKPTGFIEDMYIDNAGAATVLSTLQACVELDVKKNLVVALCLAENAISSTAVLPSAIIKSYKGLTVEIGNTDAEGRLVLADGMTYVQKHCKPSHIVDVATLTGACVVALGEYAAGLFTNDDAMAAQMKQAGESTSEVFWPLPILDEHAEELKGIDSDLKNIGKGRYGGASTAAAFLREFVEKDVKWCHLDIAGPAKARGDKVQGASGFGVQMLVEWLSKTSL